MTARGVAEDGDRRADGPSAGPAGGWNSGDGPQCARPLVWFASAMALGAAFGRWDALDRVWLPCACAALVGAWLARRNSRHEALANTPSARPSVLALAVVAALSALRAPYPALWGEPAFHRTRGDAGDGSRGALRGEWAPSSASEHGEFGRLVDADAVSRRAVLPIGAARAGETLELLTVARPFRPAQSLARAPGAIGSLDAPELWRVELDEVRRLAPADGALTSWGPLQRLRAWSLARCERFGGEPAALARALLFGDESRVQASTGELFTRTGVRHVLSVSGMHVALLAGALALLLATPPRGAAGRVGSLITLAAIGTYSVLSGAQAPVRRAALTLCLGVAAAAWGRRRDPSTWRRPDPLTLLAAALVVELCVDPRTLFSLSLQLSYGATLGLVLGAGPLARWVRSSRRSLWSEVTAGLWRSRVTRGVARTIDALIGDGARLRGSSGPNALACVAARGLDGALGASLAATLATAPIVWVTLGEISPIGVISTVCVSPLIAWLLTYGLAAVYMPLPASGFAEPCEWLLAALRAFDHAPASPLPLPPRPLWLAGLATVGLLCWSARRAPRVSDLGRRLAQACAGLALLPWSPAPNGVEVCSLDAGHGSAFVLRTPLNEVWLFDAGSKDRYGLERLALGPQLAAWEASELNVVVSHTDRDHSSALAWLAERWKMRTWVGPPPERVGARRPSEAHMQALDGSLELHGRGELRIVVVPGAATSAANPNEGSLAAAVWAWGRRILVTGDAVDEGLEHWLASGRLPRDVDLLVWPHHGDPTERASELLRATRPRLVWISGARPGGVEAELDRQGVKWSATYQAGPLYTVLAREPP